MAECKPCSTPVDMNPKVSATDGAPVADASDFRSLAGALQYLTFTRPDITYVVQQVCLHMHDPREPHHAALKRILCYIHGTLQFGLMLRPSSCSDLMVYTDVDWAGCPDTRKSTSGYAVFLGDNLIPGPPSDRPLYQDPVLKQSIAQWLTGSPKRCGCANSSRSFVLLFTVPLWCIVITSAPSTCPPTRFSINARSILRLTSTSSASMLPLVISACYMFPHRHNTPISSPKGCLLHCLQSSGPV
jgi:hypothetical protein